MSALGRWLPLCLKWATCREQSIYSCSSAETRGNLQLVPDKTLRDSDIARAEMRRLEGIVQTLRLSPPALHLKQVDPNDLLNNVQQLVAPEARERGLHLHLERPRFKSH